MHGISDSEGDQSQPISTNFPVFSLITGNWTPETSSQLTASTATCPCEVCLPIQLRPDFPLFLEGYAGGPVNRPWFHEARKRSLRANILRTC